jgi:phosphate transport system permease protein
VTSVRNERMPTSASRPPPQPAPNADNGANGANGAPRPRPAARPTTRTPVRPRELTGTDVATMIGCAVSAVSLSWLVFTVLTDGIGWLGFGLSAYVMFLLLLFVVTAETIGVTAATDRVATAVVVSSAALLLVPLVWLVGYVILKGVPGLTAHFFTEDQKGVTPILPSTAGGGSHAIVGTIMQVGLALVWAVPLGVLAAVFLNESRSKWRRPVRIFVDAMSGLPSVIAGLFIFAVLILPYAKKVTFNGWQVFSYNGFMASLALAMIMLPTITRTVEVVLRLVPDGLREASLALGSSKARTVWSVVLPTARTGITTAVVLGIARAVGETAPLLFTAFGYDLMNSNPFDGSQESLPLFVYRNIRKPDLSAIERGFTGALVLMMLVIGLFALARFIGRDRSGRSGKRRRRLKLPSLGDQTTIGSETQ